MIAFVSLAMDQNAEEPSHKAEHSSFMLGKAEVGKARTRGFDMHTPPPPDRKNDETAIRALRGWSDSMPVGFQCFD